MTPNPKTILITGASDGIGKESAKALARQGHNIILHGRNQQKTQAVQNEIIAESGNKNIDCIIADFLLLSEVKQFADAIKQKYDHIDVLMNNAGAIFDKERQTTPEGFEKTIALNLFAPFLLTELLMDLLKKSDAARIVNISSEMHKWCGKPDLNDFQLEKSYAPGRAYGLTKLYLIWITRYLADDLRSKGITNITANSLHPGVVATNFGQAGNNGFMINFLFKVVYKFLTKSDKGAETSIYAAVSPEVATISGEYFKNKKIAKVDDKYYSKENEKKVWEYCMEVVKNFL